MKKEPIADTIRSLLSPTAGEMGYRLWDVEYVKEGATWYLRITIDQDSGITLDDCERFHRAIDPILDEADPIEGAYTLEVSSPGLERNLKYPEHFAACIGEEVEIRLFAPDAEGSKVYTGTLISFSDGQVGIRAGGKDRLIPVASVASARTRFDFDSVDLT
ncbi:MAG: ribosome maturation factor RimP [Clostridia bacterium]|nr:ribosome maturation factor RimP [Clostridia bacterium]